MTDDSTTGLPPNHSHLVPYARTAGVFDEALDESGAIRAPWRRLLNWMADVGPSELQRQEEMAHARISEDGVAYHVHDDPVRAARPWPLDIVPMVLGPEDWAGLERGLDQRARLLDLLLSDLHGPQRALREGIVPADLVFGVPSFLRACHDPMAGPRTMLHLYACDLVRTSSGQWRVLADRTQAPAGLGFALENRVVSSRLLSEPFVEDRVHRLAPFFRSVRESLASLDPRRQDNPRVVILTPGPGNETYFENAYLAHYLGYTLVEADDLTVRHDGVHLKMFGGLKRVDVIVRRIDDAYCDPVELRGDSLVGVPGLVAAVRQGQVAVANALGAGLAATPALMPYLPAACRFFLGEDLRLESVRSVWCGDPDSLEEALSNHSSWMLFHVAGDHPSAPIRPERLAPAERDALWGAIRSAPGQYVAQERASLGTTPQLDRLAIRPSHAILRTFLVRRGDSYEAMPGGLTRMTPAEYADSLPVYQGVGSKDTWVMSDDPVEQFSMLMPASSPMDVTRGGGDVPSRVADHLFWLGRYKERLEAGVRILRVVMLRMLEQGTLEPGADAGFALRLASVYPLEGLADLPVVDWPRAILNADRAGSLAQQLEVIQRNCGRVRDRFSGDTWRILNRLFVDAPAPHPDPWQMFQRLVDWFNVTIIRLSAFDGMTLESMTRGPGWRFLDMGRRLERALHVARMVESAFVAGNGAPAASLCEDVLSIADSLITFRRRYLTRLQLAPLLDLLLIDATNPRSVAFQVERLREHLEALAESAPPACSAAEAGLQPLTDALRSANVQALAAPGPDGRRDALEAWIRVAVEWLPAISDALTTRYFSHSAASRSFSGWTRFQTTT